MNKLKCCSCQKTFSTEYNFEIHCDRAHANEKIVAAVWVKKKAKRECMSKRVESIGIVQDKTF